jgi:hypothetical protein
MKYKEQALRKLERIEHKAAALESSISRGMDISTINQNFKELRESIESLRDTISIENDEMNY